MVRICSTFGALAFLGVLLIWGKSSIFPTGSLSSKDIAKRVAAVYGEQNPHIIHVNAAETDNSGDPMYVVIMSGRFDRANITARYLRFSALANGKYVWAIYGYKDLHTSEAGDSHWVWADSELP